jgi:SAM-dependent methyltransferase
MLFDFYQHRLGSKVLDVGCNTGKNMARALRYGGLGTAVFGLEYSQDSVALAKEFHGEDHVFQGDASLNFVDIHSWADQFSVVQCTAVLQHMTPEQVEAALQNMSRCLKPGGELLLTFKDAPTKTQLHDLGMEAWSEQVFSADLLNEDKYNSDGFLRATMWDDDYYPGVTNDPCPAERSFDIPGMHLRDFFFYSLEWMKHKAQKVGLAAKLVEVMPDSKVPFSALHWMVVFQRSHAAN